MKKNEIKTKVLTMPIEGPAYKIGPIRFVNREYLIIEYETDETLLKRLIPEPLELQAPIVKYEFIRMPDSYSLGNYTESGQVIPIKYKGKPGNFTLSMYLDNFPAIVAGREIWGFPKKWAKPHLEVQEDALIGTLHYGSELIARGSMGYKYEQLKLQDVKKATESPNYLLKVMPNPDGSPRICELVCYYLTDLEIQGAWKGPSKLELFPHAMAPVANLPIHKVISATHFIANLTLDLGEVVVNYL